MPSLTPRAILIDVIPPEMEKRVAGRRLLELESLTKTYGGLIIVKLFQKRAMPNYATYVGSGKLEEILALAKANNVELLIINNLLKPKQLFEVEEFFRKQGFPLSVWDRVDLILKIFSKHAKTAEAKLQIKVAAIRHMGPRIFGMGMEMMRQAGGIGGRGGQGESNTEMMKRHLAQQEQHALKELEKVSASRSLHRARRDRVGLKTASIVGYTNAGKSSLLNALTQKGAYVANVLFATLDTRVGKLWLPDIVKSEEWNVKRQTLPEGTTRRVPREILLSDTIGFIQDLPPQLIQAFQSTLDETVDADLLLHVIDVADPFVHEKIAEVEEVLRQLGVEETPKIYVFNKIDLKKRIPRATLVKKYKAMTPVFVSTQTGEGLKDLRMAIARRM